MLQKIIAGAFVLGMIGAVVIGVVKVVAPSTEEHAYQGRGAGRQALSPQGVANQVGQANGQRRGQGQGSTGGYEGGQGQEATDADGRGKGQETIDGSGRQGQGTTGGYGRGQGQGGGSGASTGTEAVAAEWQTIEGTVLETAELVLETADGETVQIGLGPSHYREGQGFVLEIGDKVRVSGYWEDDEFKAGQVKNLETGASIQLRDTSGRPMWAGQGRRSS